MVGAMVLLERKILDDMFAGQFTAISRGNVQQLSKQSGHTTKDIATFIT